MIRTMERVKKKPHKIPHGPKHTLLSVKHGRVSVKVWPYGCQCSWPPLAFIDDLTADRSNRMNAELYESSLCAQIQPNIKHIGQQFIIQQDKDTKQTTKATEDYTTTYWQESTQQWQNLSLLDCQTKISSSYTAKWRLFSLLHSVAMFSYLLAMSYSSCDSVVRAFQLPTWWLLVWS